MSESLKAAVRLAVLRILDPLVKWLIEAGLGVGDLVALVKIAYVRAARERGLAGGGEAKRPNVSRIAVVTGLTRVEVTNILATGAADPVYDRGRQRAERVLSGWWNDVVFQDPSGHPAVLPLRVASGPSRGWWNVIVASAGSWRRSSRSCFALKPCATCPMGGSRQSVDR